MPKMSNPNVLVGFDGSDDAAVYRIHDELAMISTLDFFTPMDDDPYVFGQIAAANALSDVYAMGGEPVLALNIVCFPCSLGTDVLSEILRGGADKVIESGAVITGGHSVDDPEPKYGLSVTGFVHPDCIWKNTGAKEGDVLILTKPLGTGILNTAVRGQLISEEQRGELLRSMSTLNKYAAEAIKSAGVTVHACTDITGFGLLGHLLEMLDQNISAELQFSEIPLLSGVSEMVLMGIIPAGAYKNMEFTEKKVRSEQGTSLYALCDPQTSGGLLLAVPEAQADSAMASLRANCAFEPKVIGRIVNRGDFEIVIKN